MKIWKPIILFLFLTACTQITVDKMGQKVNDDALMSAEWVICKAASHGAVDRRYGMSIDRANLHKSLCHGGAGANTIGPALESR